MEKAGILPRQVKPESERTGEEQSCAGQEEAKGLTTTLATMLGWGKGVGWSRGRTDHLDDDAVDAEGGGAVEEVPRTRRKDWQAGAAGLGSTAARGGQATLKRPGLKGGPDQLGRVAAVTGLLSTARAGLADGRRGWAWFRRGGADDSREAPPDTKDRHT